MTELKLEVQALSEVEAVAQKLLDLSKDCKIILLRGELGSGKTALTKFICKLLNVKDEASSPTFSLVNQYETESGEQLYHFDLYRLKSIEEAIDIGCEEYFNSGKLCLIEWPEIAMEIIPDEHIDVLIELKGENRWFNISKFSNVR